MNTVQELYKVGQSMWYDNIQRGMLVNGEMAGMVNRGEILGVTSNPTIFMNALLKSTDYDGAITPLAQAGWNAQDIFTRLAVEDIQAAADLFKPLYEATGGGDGYVSLEVSPYLANDSQSTLAEARHLWERVNRPNLMVKIPATLAGLPAVRDAIAEGININVTLIFSRERYAAVMDAFMSGLEKRLAAGLPVNTIASVASFFVSRVDTKVDERLSRINAPLELFGKAAVANAKLAYADFKATFAAERWQPLKAAGARAQRPLWASTGTKNPKYSDVMYVEELIGPHTVNTVPPQTLAAFLDHGKVRLTLEEDLDAARKVFADLEALGISMAEVTRELEEEGVKAFADSFTGLLAAVEKSRAAV